MDRHFMEFWGNFMIHAAKGQKQLEDMAKWMEQGLRGFDGLTDMFRKFYGLDHTSETKADHGKTWEKATEDFQASFEEYLKLFGVVPLQEHLELVKRYEALKEKSAAQEETIKHMRMLLEEKWMDQGEVVKGFQALIKKQTDQFHDLMRGFDQPVGKDPSAD